MLMGYIPGAKAVAAHTEKIDGTDCKIPDKSRRRRLKSS